MVSSLSLESMPEDLRALICSKVAADSLKENRTLQLVSKTFKRLCNERYVLRRVSLSLDELPLRPWFRHEEQEREFTKFVGRCFSADNPGAKYRIGVVQFFGSRADEQQVEEGFRHLAVAAHNGIQEAQLVYGSILLCIGGDSKKEGNQILSRLRVPLVENSDPHCWIQPSWMCHVADVRYSAELMLNRLKTMYVREQCKCEGSKEGLLQEAGDFSDRFTRFQVLSNSIRTLYCESCVCHHVLQIFFDVMEN